MSSSLNTLPAAGDDARIRHVLSDWALQAWVESASEPRLVSSPLSSSIVPTPMNSSEPVSKGARITGYVLIVLVSLLMAFSGVMKLIQPPEMMAQAAPMGLSAHQLACIGVVEIACAVIFLIPAASVLGAILVAAYMGGAVCISVHAGANFVGPIIVGVVAWGGVYLRDPRVRALVPFKS